MNIREYSPLLPNGIPMVSQLIPSGIPMDSQRHPKGILWICILIVGLMFVLIWIRIFICIFVWLLESTCCCIPMASQWHPNGIPVASQWHLIHITINIRIPLRMSIHIHFTILLNIREYPPQWHPYGIPVHSQWHPSGMLVAIQWHLSGPMTS